MVRLLLSFFLLFFTAPTWADAIQGLRVSSDNQSARLVFDLDNKVSYNAFTLANPDRLVIDLKGFQQRDKLTIPSLINTPIKAVRYAAYDQNTLRVVLDLAHEVKYQTQTLPPQENYPIA
nr:AMIN domain-containing protein [uncultured Methylophaga sp.]